MGGATNNPMTLNGPRSTGNFRIKQGQFSSLATTGKVRGNSSEIIYITPYRGTKVPDVVKRKLFNNTQ